jgi:thioredoxin 1
MTIIDVSEINELEKLFNEHKYIVVKFSAHWCLPCKRIHPVYENYSNCEKYKSICFVHVDLQDSEESVDLCNKFKISGMPTFVLFENNVEINRFSGANESKLLDLLNKCFN